MFPHMFQKKQQLTVANDGDFKN